MGRLNKTTASRPSVRVHYRKLIDEYSSNCDVLKFVPALPDYLSYSCHQCGHTQKLQDDELNSVLGNAFRMACTAQLQKQSTFQKVIAAQVNQTNDDKVHWTKTLPIVLCNNKVEMDIHLNNSGNDTTTNIRLAPPSNIPGLQKNNGYNELGSNEKDQSLQSTPSSDDCNSPTELNTNKRILEKPSLVKKIAMGFSSNVAKHNSEDDMCPLVSNDCSRNSSPSSPSHRPLSGGYINEHIHENDKALRNVMLLKNERLPSKVSKRMDSDQRASSSEQHLKTEGISFLTSSSSNLNHDSQNKNSFPMQERQYALNMKEYLELRIAPWFQAGIPREIVLEILGQEPIGSFLVRESTSKPGCFALSLRVPRSFQPAGVAHYLIIRINKGYKIKGFTKEFATLTSLIVHHSVMPELLPCTLSLNRYNPAFAKSDTDSNFAEVDLDSDYETLADFRKMMADLNH